MLILPYAGLGLAMNKNLIQIPKGEVQSPEVK
jgi:hypothetical protein